MSEETAAYTANGEPKYPFVGRIVEAYYTNPDLTEIDIIHNYDIPDDVIVYVPAVLEDSEAAIIRSTVGYIKVSKKSVKFIARRAPALLS